MDKEFVTYEQALALKELGFNERCLRKSEHTKKCVEKERPGGCQLHNLHCGYPDCTIDKTITPIPLPLKQQVFKFFREKYGWHTNLSLWDGIDYVFDIYSATEVIDSSITYDTYEKAENACIDKLIEICKQQKDINVPLSK